MKKLITLIFALLLLITIGYAQEETLCDVRIIDSTEVANIENQIRNSIVQTSIDECKTIRTVVHVVYNGNLTNAPFNGDITPEQVKSQIRITNQFFRNDSLVSNPNNIPLGYQLELASTDPDGNPTTGIIYYDGVELFGEAWATWGLEGNNSNAVSPSIVSSELAWGTDVNGKKYLNTYIVPKIDGSNGGGIQAYAYFPTNNVIFGNYNLANAFGAEQLEDEYGQNFNLKSYTDLGYTWTHELLHNFAIFHTFQGNSCIDEVNCLAQGDRICDTPPQTQGFSCIGSCGFLSENVMDYLNQSCKTKITQGQVDRAISVIQFSLADYLVCTECLTNADVNGDGGVNITDISVLNLSFGSQIGDSNYNPLADLNCDGVINVIDVSILVSELGTSSRLTIDSNYMQDKNTKVYDMTGRRVTGELSTGFYIFETNGIRIKQFILR